MGVGYSTAIDVIEKEFVEVQRLQSPSEAPRRNITYEELKLFSPPESLRVDLNHIAVLFVIDANRDGLFSYDDLVAFAMWVASTLPHEIPTNEFSDAVQARCVLKMWKECMDAPESDKNALSISVGVGTITGVASDANLKRGRNRFVDWACLFIKQNYQSGDDEPQVRRRMLDRDDTPVKPEIETIGDKSNTSSTSNDSLVPVLASTAVLGSESETPAHLSVTGSAFPPMASSPPDTQTPAQLSTTGSAFPPLAVVPSPAQHHTQGEPVPDLRLKLSNLDDGDAIEPLPKAITDGDEGDENNGSLSSDDSIEQLLRPSRAVESKVEVAEVFNLASIQCIYTLLNVNEGYGLGFHTFCQVLHPDRGVLSTPGFSGGDHLQAVTSTGAFDDPEFSVPGASMRAFLGAFITSYWGILNKLGLDVLLSD